MFVVRTDFAPYWFTDVEHTSIWLRPTSSWDTVTGGCPDFGWWIKSQGLEDAAVEVSLADVGHRYGSSKLTMLIFAFCGNLHEMEVTRIEPRFHLRWVVKSKCLANIGIRFAQFAQFVQ